MTAPAPGMVVVRCPTLEDGARCDHPLMDAPESWGTYEATSLVARDRPSGRGLVKRCTACKRWVDVVFAARGQRVA